MIQGLPASEQRIDAKPAAKMKRITFLRIAAAAVLLIVGIAVVYTLLQPKAITGDLNVDVPPGGNKAVLTLADGRMIPLSEDKEGIALQTEGIRYTDGTALLADDKAGTAAQYTLTTPRGGQYQITLSDGTRVWLN